MGMSQGHVLMEVLGLLQGPAVLLVAGVSLPEQAAASGVHHGGQHLPEGEPTAVVLGWAVGWDGDLH